MTPGFRALADACERQSPDLVRGDTEATPHLRIEWSMGATVQGPAIWTTSVSPSMTPTVTYYAKPNP